MKAILTNDIVINENVLNEDKVPYEKDYIDGLVIGQGYTFKGIFDGNNHTIYGFYNDSGGSNLGLFGVNEGKILNLNVKDSYLKGGSIGGIVGKNEANGVIDNCSFDGVIESTGFCAGITANNEGVVTNSSTYGKINSTGLYIGGIAGQNKSTGTISNCVNYATITGSQNFAGIVGHSEASIKNCVNKGNIVGGNLNIGGIAGATSGSITIEQCGNEGKISVNGAHVGGIVGQLSNNSIINNCYNTAVVESTYASAIIGGIVGSGVTVNNSFSIGTVGGYEKAMGYIAGSQSGNCTNCYYLYFETDFEVNKNGDETQIAKNQVTSGELTYLLNKNQNKIWKQTIGQDLIPNFTGADVFYGFTTCDESQQEKIYTNNVLASDLKPDHIDTNKNHHCDFCFSAVGNHIDENKDHICDYGCLDNIETCYDYQNDGDHNCEYCNTIASDHIDEDKNHVCDECNETVGEHTDTSGDKIHLCLYCNINDFNCIDEDKDHVCDECSNQVGSHIDENKDHICDYGCNETIGEHIDSDDLYHKCDYCDVDIINHIDENKDHLCDECNENVGDHIDANGDNVHLCLYCNINDFNCIDEDKNHLCDECNETVSEHIDTSGDNIHLCLYCNSNDFNCIDEDKDHLCDECSNQVGSHIDENKDHICDYGCNEKYSDCSGGVATCSSRAICETCKKEYGNLLDHNFGESQIIVESTKTQNGKAIHTCTVCNYSEEIILPKNKNSNDIGKSIILVLSSSFITLLIGGAALLIKNKFIK